MGAAAFSGVVIDALGVIDAVTREAMLFAGVGFLLGGIDDLCVDALFFARVLKGRRREVLPRPARAPIAIFVPAWDEACVLGAMLRHALARIAYRDYRIYVGTYPNDRATIDAVAAIAEQDARVRLVVGVRDGPTTKADCLNTLWQALARDAEWRPRAVVLHDAEDVIHADELALFDARLGVADAVQLPVLPLVDPRARLVSGHYADEFAEAHQKQLVVRAGLGAGLPLAGVGCAVSTTMLAAIADARGGAPFDAASLTEDYELGLAIATAGGRADFVREHTLSGELIAVRAYFPGRLDAAVRQKARWMTGIALAGWDRIGWGARFDWREHWMRMRDRRAPLAVLVLGAAYVGLVGWGLGGVLHWARAAPVGSLPLPGMLLGINGALLGWRLAMRAGFTGAAYGWREALWSVPRAFVGNLIALLAARRAITSYFGLLAGRAPKWDKTAHQFPAELAEGRQ